MSGCVLYWCHWISVGMQVCTHVCHVCLSGEIIHNIYYPSLSLCAESSGLFGRSTREEEKPQPHSDTKKPQVNSGTHTHSISFFLSLSLSLRNLRLVGLLQYIVGTHTHIIYLSLS